MRVCRPHASAFFSRLHASQFDGLRSQRFGVHGLSETVGTVRSDTSGRRLAWGKSCTNVAPRQFPYHGRVPVSPAARSAFSSCASPPEDVGQKLRYITSDHRDRQDPCTKISSWEVIEASSVTTSKSSGRRSVLREADMVSTICEGGP